MRPVRGDLRGVLELRRDVDGHKGSVEAAGSCAGIVKIAPNGGVGRIFVEVMEAVGEVNVAVDEQGLLGQPRGACVEGLRGLGRGGALRECKKEQSSPNSEEGRCQRIGERHGGGT